MADRTIREVARRAAPWRIAGNALALICLIAAVYGFVFGVLGAIVETQEQRAEVVSDG